MNEKILDLSGKYLYLPARFGGGEHKLEAFVQREDGAEQILELKLPWGEEADLQEHTVCVPVNQYLGQKLLVTGEFPEEFFKKILTGDNEIPRQGEKTSDRPAIHFTADKGWINDPNGLVYCKGIYHLFFQYNPCNKVWGNMSWGHAISRDLLHWEQLDTALWPDCYGTMFSGCAIQKEKDIYFFYSAAGGSNDWSFGKAFTQRTAISHDDGFTLQKLSVPLVDTIAKENRDPKIFWHEESGAYIMVLWIEKNDFAILRSETLEEWHQTDQFTLEDAWECPDLLCLYDERGDKHWMFTSADGFYYWGEFDGYHFYTDSIKHYAYGTKLPYAAQTFTGIKDRTVSIPWLRVPNDGREFTGAMGIPVELSVGYKNGRACLVQRPVRELFEQRTKIYGKEDLVSGHLLYEGEEGEALVLEFGLSEKSETAVHVKINDETVSYAAATGLFQVGDETILLEEKKREFIVVIDDNLLEVWSTDGIISAAFVLKNRRNTIRLECCFDESEFDRIELYNMK